MSRLARGVGTDVETALTTMRESNLRTETTRRDHEEAIRDLRANLTRHEKRADALQAKNLDLKDVLENGRFPGWVFRFKRCPSERRQHLSMLLAVPFNSLHHLRPLRPPFFSPLLSLFLSFNSPGSNRLFRGGTFFIDQIPNSPGTWSGDSATRELGTKFLVKQIDT